MQNNEQKRVLSVQAIASTHVPLLASICRAASLTQAMQFLNQIGINNAQVESGSHSSSDRPGHLEIWFSNK